jgi:predicted DNA-binding helix-hairpin-helix protein
MDIAPPPPAYDRPYQGRLELRVGTIAQVQYVCHTMEGIVSSYRALGCAKKFSGYCFVMIPKVSGKITAHMQTQIRRHEIAHCNGWGASHPRS